MTTTATTYGDDTLSSIGARKLKARIEAYWKNRGYAVDVRVIDGPFIPSLREHARMLRSNMKNGLPEGCAPKRLLGRGR